MCFWSLLVVTTTVGVTKGERMCWFSLVGCYTEMKGDFVLDSLGANGSGDHVFGEVSGIPLNLKEYVLSF